MINKETIRAFIKQLLPDLDEAYKKEEIDPGDSTTKPYASFSLTSIKELGLPIVRHVPSSADPVNLITEMLIIDKTVQLQIEFFTDAKSVTEPNLKEADEFCEEFLAKIYLESAREFQNANDFAVVNVLDFTDTSEYIVDKWEKRAVCELTLNYKEVVSEDIDFIETVGTEGTYYDETGNPL